MYIHTGATVPTVISKTFSSSQTEPLVPVKHERPLPVPQPLVAPGPSVWLNVGPLQTSCKWNLAGFVLL